MAALLSPPLMQVSFSPFRKVVSEPMKPHGDAAQLANQESIGGGLSGTHVPQERKNSRTRI